MRARVEGFSGAGRPVMSPSQSGAPEAAPGRCCDLSQPGRLVSCLPPPPAWPPGDPLGVKGAEGPHGEELLSPSLSSQVFGCPPVPRGRSSLPQQASTSCCYFCFSLKLPSKQLYWKIPTLPWMNQEEKPSVHTQTSPVQPGRSEAPGAALGTSLQLQRQPERGGIWTAAASGVGSGGAARGP